MTKIEMNVLD